MDLAELEGQGSIQKLPVDGNKVRDAFRLAERDLRTAKEVMKTDHNWAFSIAYNAILQASRALMFSEGYRSHGTAQHVSVVKFVEAFLGDEFSDSIIAFDRMRRKRHIAVYGAPGLISTTESENAIRRAEQLLSRIEGMLVGKGHLETRKKTGTKTIKGE